MRLISTHQYLELGFRFTEISSGDIRMMHSLSLGQRLRLVITNAYLIRDRHLRDADLNEAALRRTHSRVAEGADVALI
jgi:hypothetical protein